MEHTWNTYVYCKEEFILPNYFHPKIVTKKKYNNNNISMIIMINNDYSIKIIFVKIIW